MRIWLYQGAGAIVALALTSLQAAGVLSGWAVVALALLGGLVAAVSFGFILIRQIPSRRRFRWLCYKGVAATILLSYCVIQLYCQMLLPGKPAVVAEAIVLAALAVAVFFAYAVWFHIVDRGYDRPAVPQSDATKSPSARSSDVR